MLKSDNQGFLLGSPIELGDVHDELKNIREEIAKIRATLHGGINSRLTRDSISNLGFQFNQGISRSGMNNRSRIISVSPLGSDSSIAFPRRKTSPFRRTNRINSQIDAPEKLTFDSHHSIGLPRSNRTSSQIMDRENNETSSTSNSENDEHGGISRPVLRDERGRFTSSNSLPTATPNRTRDSSGRFTSNGSGDDGHDSKSSLGLSGVGSAVSSVGNKFKQVGDSVVGAITNLASGNEEASPDIKAMQEVVQTVAPVARGFKGVFTAITGSNGVSRGQDRWYRRFFKIFSDRGRAEDAAYKREQRLLKNLDKSDKKDNGKMWMLGFIAPLLAILSQFLSGFLKTALAKMGLSKLADVADNLGQKLKKVVTPFEKIKDDLPKGGIFAKAGKGAKGFMKRIPLLGSLISLGFMAGDVYSSESDDSLTRAQKNVKTGGAIGKGVGGLAGAVAGGAAGAAIGSAVPVVGTVIGGVVGSILGSLGGGKIGDILGSKFGEWVNTLKESGFIDRVVHDWHFATSAMSIMWGDFTKATQGFWQGAAEFAKVTWGVFVASLTAVWNGVARVAEAAWLDIKSAYVFASAFIGRVWDNIKDNFFTVANFAEGIWTGIGGYFSGVIDFIKNAWSFVIDGMLGWIKDKTGVDLGKAWGDIKKTFVGWFDDAKDAIVKTTGALRKIGNYVQSVGNRAEKQANILDKQTAENSSGGGSNGSSSGSDSYSGRGLNTNFVPNARAKTRGERNNNAGNLVFAHQSGASREANGGKFAVFNTAQEGMNSLYGQLQRYYQGKTTGRKLQSIRAIINTYAPASDNNNTNAYIAEVARKLGVSPDAKVDINDPTVSRELMKAIVTVENGRNIYSDDMYNNAFKNYHGGRVSSSSTETNDVSSGSSIAKYSKI